MDENKRRIFNAKLAQRHGWCYRDGVWDLHQPRDCEEGVPEMLEGNKSIDCWTVEELLLRYGWRFEFAEGLFIATRTSDGFRIRRYNRREVIGLAYIATAVEGPMRKRTDCKHPLWPVGLDHQCWLGDPYE